MEFKFLVGPELAEAEAQLPVEQRVSWPLDSIIMYCYEGSKIIGRMGAMNVKVIEGTWAAPDAPPTTAFRMMRQMEAMLAYLGDTHALALTPGSSPEIGDYLSRTGFEKLPLSMYSKSLVAKEKAA